MISEKPLWTVLLILISLSVLSCIKENPGNTEDTPVSKKDSVTFILNNSLNADSIKATVTWLQNMGTRFLLANNHRQVAVRIKDTFRRIGYYNAHIDSFSLSITYRNQEYNTWQYNVVAELRGSLHPDSVNIIGAHYDSKVTAGDPFLKAPGANDNGSGVAAMIEIARIMKLKGYSPDISIQFVAFAAEEAGLFGSSDFAARLAGSGRPAGIMINNDMIANMSNPNRLLWAVKIKYYDNSQDFSVLAAKICEDHANLIPEIDSTGKKKSDSYSFYKKNFMPVYFTSGSTDYNYHTIGDLAVECNFKYCVLVAKLSTAMLVHLSTG
jgi:Zn-dependent M28 family amino/carboxypeptidase